MRALFGFGLGLLSAASAAQIAFIVERAAIVRLLDHLGEPSRMPRRAPIRGPPCAGEWGDGNDIGDCTSLVLDPPVDVMPDYENQRQDVSG